MGNPTRRRWIKLYPIECLDGSIRYQLTPAQRGVWYDLLNFSALCSNDGVIADRSGNAFPRSFIANRLNVPVPLLNATLENCVEEGRLRINEDGVIFIHNWTRYQSEYDRQKPYRKSLATRTKEKQQANPDMVHGFVNEPSYDIDEKEREQDRQALVRGDTPLEFHEAAIEAAHLKQQSP